MTSTLVLSSIIHWHKLGTRVLKAPFGNGAKAVLICNTIPTIKPFLSLLNALFLGKWRDTAHLNFLHAVVCLCMSLCICIFLCRNAGIIKIWARELYYKLIIDQTTIFFKYLPLPKGPNRFKITCSSMKCPAMNCRMKCCLRSNEFLIFSL